MRAERRGLRFGRAATGGVSRARVTSVPAVGSPPVAAVASDALAHKAWRILGCPQPWGGSISDRLPLPIHSPVAAIGRRSRGGPLLPTAEGRVDQTDFFSLEWSGKADRSVGPLLVVNNSFQSRRAIARGPLLQTENALKDALSGGVGLPSCGLWEPRSEGYLSKKVRRLPIVGPVTADGLLIRMVRRLPIGRASQALA